MKAREEELKEQQEELEKEMREKQEELEKEMKKTLGRETKERGVGYIKECDGDKNEGRDKSERRETEREARERERAETRETGRKTDRTPHKGRRIMCKSGTLGAARRTNEKGKEV